MAGIEQGVMACAEWQIIIAVGQSNKTARAVRLDKQGSTSLVQMTLAGSPLLRSSSYLSCEL